MANNSNVFDMLSVMCDMAIMIADGNWGDTNVAQYVRSHIPNCEHVEAFRDILHPVIARRQVSQEICELVEDKQMPLEKKACATQLALDRNVGELTKLRDQVNAEIRVCNETLSHLARNMQIAKIMRNTDLEGKVRSEYASMIEVKKNSEELVNQIVELINIIK